MDPNTAAVLIALAGSLTTIVVALINLKKSSAIEKKVDTGNSIANGRTERLERELAEKNEEIQRLARLLPPPKKGAKP